MLLVMSDEGGVCSFRV